jgi:hypothetical protein
MNDKLIKIQQELNAPKSLYNSYSHFYYRSAETILEAVKPLLKKYDLSLVLTDEAVQVGAWNYIRSTAILTDTDNKETFEVFAYAREQETKKGMDAAQITGAASSYARKYALNGLFAIDDTKDPDTNEHKEQTDKKSAPSNYRNDLFKAFKDQGITDSQDMMAHIQQAIGKDVVDTAEEAKKVIRHLNEE